MAILINDTAPRSQYTATASQTVFTVPFEFFENADLKVYQNATLLTLATNYTVTGAGLTGGGSITLLVGATVNDIVSIVRDVAVKRVTDFPTSGPFNVEALNTDLDRLTAMVQQQETLDTRSLRLDQFDTPNSLSALPVKASRIGRVLQFNSSTGQPEAGPTTSEVSNAQTYATNAATSATASAASASAASSSASAASTSASNASASATAASASTTAAAVSAAAAATSASNASTSATTASTQATTATTQANNATTQAANAATSATTASTQATNATTSATAAASSATSAASSATTATTQATNATTSASAASSSAAAAAASAASGLYRQVLDKSANYTIVNADQGTLFRVNTASGAITLTLPSISATSDGFKVSVVKWTSDANLVNINRAGTDTINGATTSQISSQYSQIIFVADFETNTWFGSQSGLGATNINVDVFSGNGSTTAFTLSSNPGSTSNTNIYIGGVHQDHVTYSISATTLTFTTAPPSGTSNIEVIYGTPLAIGTPTDGTVTPAKLSTGGPYWDGSSNVGIGTSSPGFKLEVVGGTNNGIHIKDAASATVFGGLFTQASNMALITRSNHALTFGTNDTTRMSIDTSGNVGIGTSSPGTKLDVAGQRFRIGSSASDPGIEISNGTTTKGYVFYDTTNDVVTVRHATPSTGISLNSSGNVGIGTTSPAAKLDVQSATQRTSFTGTAAGVLNVKSTTANGDYASLTFQGSGGNPASKIAYQQTASGGTLSFGTSNDYSLGITNTAMTIDSSGNLVVGATATVSSARFYSVNSAGIAGVFYNSAASQQTIAALRIDKADNTTTTAQVFAQFTINAQATGSGQINANGVNAAAFGTYSDKRLKENIVELPSQLANICALRPVEFDFIASEGGGHQIGFIAQEVNEIYPDLVGEREDGMFTLSDMNKNDARLIKAIQELKAQNDALTARVAALETK